MSEWSAIENDIEVQHWTPMIGVQHWNATLESNIGVQHFFSI